MKSEKPCQDCYSVERSAATAAEYEHQHNYEIIIYSQSIEWPGDYSTQNCEKLIKENSINQFIFNSIKEDSIWL